MDEKESRLEELECMFTNESAEPNKISYSVIESITKHFYQEIGRGGYGTVYLGALRNDVMVAVKQLCQSDNLSDIQFLEEVNCLKRVNHENIVRFLGYCAYTDERLMNVEGKDMLVGKQKRFLCFEYAPNGNLHDYLQVSSGEKTYGDEWSIRYKIIKGICQGLLYLHQKRINHLDLKPANVLLGAQMEPKITDFGLSRCNDGTQSTVFTTHLLGTLGYIAPELIDEGKISFKSDIYSLGIIMKRLLTGMKKDVPENWHETLNVDCQQMKRCYEIAQNCADKDPYRRPTISEIICKLTETETMIQNVPPVITTEPRNDPTSTFYLNVKRFLALQPQTREYYRWPEKLRVERPKWKLAFHSPLKLPIITGKKIEDANGNPLEVILVDAETGEPVALPTVLQIKLVPLLGNFPQDSWDTDNFQRGVVEDLEWSRPILAGDHRLTMWDGRVTVNEIMFTDDSLMCGCMFRIGARVEPGSYHGARILEGMTEAFKVHDIPTEMQTKNYPPALDDEVWRLEGISWGGVIHKRLTQNNIRNVLDFLRMLAVKPDELSAIIGEGNSAWEEITRHARTCALPTKMTKKHYPPTLRDEVWRLDCISWAGVFHNRLTQNSIRNVQDFLRMLAVHPDELRAIIGDDMEDCTWQQIARHARDCVIPVHEVYATSAAHAIIYVNCIFDLVKVEFGGVECPLQQLDETQKGLVQQAMRDAYEHRHSLQAVKLKLAFKSPPRLPIHTGSLIKDATGNPLEIILVDAKTGSSLALPTPLHIQLVPLYGDFPANDKEDWSAEEFRMAFVKPRKGNVPVLKGATNLHMMRNGHVTVDEHLQFTDDSSWVRSRKFRIGACVKPRPRYDDNACRILEAVTDAFVVGDLNRKHRKHYPPVLSDKDGAVHRKLTSNNIDTVQDFLRIDNVKPYELRKMLSGGNTHGIPCWITTAHASKCDPGDKVYAYNAANSLQLKRPWNSATTTLSTLTGCCAVRTPPPRTSYLPTMMSFPFPNKLLSWKTRRQAKRTVVGIDSKYFVSCNIQVPIKIGSW